MPIPAGGGGQPDWAPDLVAVAKYVPRRTIVAAADGYADPQRTFTADTHPVDLDVELLIGDAVAWVQAAVAAPDASLWGQAGAAAALWAAGMVELTFPDNRDDLSTAEQLLTRADSMRTDLDRANQALTGVDPEDPQANVLPVWSFPSPTTWGDLTI